MQFRRKPIRAFVLSGGGARGALQVGAARALFEAGIQPDLLLGTSAGGINAAMLAIEPSLAGVDALADSWRQAAAADLLPTASLRMALRLLRARSNGKIDPKLQRFLLNFLPDPELRFGDIKGPPLYLVATELNRGEPFLFGSDPNHRLIEGLLATTAIPPWMQPLTIDGRQYLDGGFVSNLAIEPAIRLGATEIFALDLKNPTHLEAGPGGLVGFLLQLTSSTDQRIVALEAEVARSRNVRVHHIRLQLDSPVPLWDFSRTEELMSAGYATTRRYLLEQDLLPGGESAWSRFWRRLAGARGRLAGAAERAEAGAVAAPRELEKSG